MTTTGQTAGAMQQTEQPSMTHLTNRHPFAAMLLIGLVLTGCDALTKPYPDRAMYAVNIEVPEEAIAGEGRGILKINRIRVVAPFDDRTFYYKMGANEFKADYYNAFFAPPDRMFTILLYDYMQSAGGFDTLLPPFSGAGYNLRLEGNIRQLYADFSEGPTPYVVIVARFFLISADTASDPVWVQENYTQRVKAESGEPEAIAQAWGDALTAMYAQVAKDLIEAVEPGSFETSPDPEVDDAEADTD